VYHALAVRTDKDLRRRILPADSPGGLIAQTAAYETDRRRKEQSNQQ
jgi:hypothetical protein